MPHYNAQTVQLLRSIGTIHLGTSALVRDDSGTLFERAQGMRQSIASKGWQLGQFVRIQRAPSTKVVTVVDQLLRDLGTDKLHESLRKELETFKLSDEYQEACASGASIADGGSRVAGMLLHAMFGTIILKVEDNEGGSDKVVRCEDATIPTVDVGSEWTAISAVCENSRISQTPATPKEIVNALVLTDSAVINGKKHGVDDIAAMLQYKITDKGTLRTVKRLLDLLSCGIIETRDLPHVSVVTAQLDRSYKAVFGDGTKPGQHTLKAFVEADGLNRNESTNALRAKAGADLYDRKRARSAPAAQAQAPDAPAQAVKAPDALTEWQNQWNSCRAFLMSQCDIPDAKVRKWIESTVNWSVVEGKFVVV
jgi:hypothetical protein